MNGYDRYLKQAEKSANQGDRLQFRGSSQKSQQQRVKARTPISTNQELLQSLNASQKMKKIKKRTKVPVVTTIFCIVGFAVTYWGYENYESIEKSLSKWTNKVEFSFMNASLANEQAPSKENSKSMNEKNKESQSKDKAQGTEEGKVAENSEAMPSTSADAVDFNFIKDFQERKKQLDQREEELKKLEAEINLQKTSIDKKLEEVENIRKQVTQQLDDRVKADEQKIDTLVQVYTQMKAPQAAKVFETLDEDLAVEILTKMKKKSAADILNLLKADRAQSLSEKYAGYRRKPSSHTGSSANEEKDSSEESLPKSKKNENKGEIENEKNIKP